MGVPEFQAIMLPLLRSISDGEVYSVSEIITPLAEVFELSEDEQRELLPKKSQTRFRNRIQWAKYYIQRAGLLESVRRGYFKITARGSEVLDSAIDRIDTEYLQKFPEFNEWRETANEKKQNGERGIPEIGSTESQTPIEILQNAYSQIHGVLASELLEQVRVIDPTDFEKLVLDLMVKMGYGDAASLTRGGADEGIDGVINEDQLGLDIIYLQAKRWQAQVGRPEIQKFVGALHGKQARKGVFISTSTFSKEANNYADGMRDPRVILIDGQRLADLMIEFDVGVSAGDTLTIKRIDTDYFDADS